MTAAVPRKMLAASQDSPSRPPAVVSWPIAIPIQMTIASSAVPVRPGGQHRPAGVEQQGPAQQVELQVPDLGNHPPDLELRHGERSGRHGAGMPSSHRAGVQHVQQGGHGDDAGQAQQREGACQPWFQDVVEGGPDRDDDGCASGDHQTGHPAAGGQGRLLGRQRRGSGLRERLGHALTIGTIAVGPEHQSGDT